MEMTRIKETIHQRLLLLRRLESIVCSEKFELFWKRAKDEERLTAQQLITLGETIQLEKLIEEKKDYYEMGFGELRELAKAAKIRNWSRASKAELIRELECRRQRSC